MVATAKVSQYFAMESLAVVVVMWAIGDFRLLAIVGYFGHRSACLAPLAVGLRPL
jgi:hypothetical protein